VAAGNGAVEFGVNRVLDDHLIDQAEKRRLTGSGAQRRGPGACRAGGLSFSGRSRVG
jgi:hypothetical protein